MITIRNTLDYIYTMLTFSIDSSQTLISLVGFAPRIYHLVIIYLGLRRFNFYVGFLITGGFDLRSN